MKKTWAKKENFVFCWARLRERAQNMHKVSEQRSDEHGAGCGDRRRSPMRYADFLHQARSVGGDEIWGGFRQCHVSHTRRMDWRKVIVTGVVISILLAPERAEAVGKAGCGSFYQDKECREDCGSCGQPCCTLEWEVGLCPSLLYDQTTAC